MFAFVSWLDSPQQSRPLWTLPSTPGQCPPQSLECQPQLPLWLRCQAQCLTRRPPCQWQECQECHTTWQPSWQECHTTSAHMAGVPHHMAGMPAHMAGVPAHMAGMPAHMAGMQPHMAGMPFAIAHGGCPPWAGQTVAAAAPNSRLKSEAVPRSSGLNTKAPAAETAPAPAAETAPTPAPGPLLMAAEPAPTQADQMAAEPTPTEPAQMAAEPTPPQTLESLQLLQHR